MPTRIIAISLILIVIAIGVGLFAYFKESTDYSKVAPQQTMLLSELLQKVDSDTSALNNWRNQLILVREAQVQSIQVDSNMSVLELTSKASSSSVIAQIDPRHNQDVKNITQGQTVAIKGILSDYTLDTDLGLGNTVQLNYCTLAH